MTRIVTSALVSTAASTVVSKVTSRAGLAALSAGVVAAIAGSSSAALVTLSGMSSVDNQYTVSLSTTPTGMGTTFISGTSWPATESGSIEITEAGTYYLQVHGIDAARPAMFIGQFSLSNSDASFSNGTQSLLTDASTGDWSVSTEGFGGAESAVIDLGPNGTSPWGFFATLGDARFIWAEGNPSPLNAYFTTVITVVPTPAGAIALGAAGLVVGSSRRRRA